MISAEYDAISFFCPLLQWRHRVNYTDLTDLYTCNYPKLEILLSRVLLRDPHIAI